MTERGSDRSIEMSVVMRKARKEAGVDGHLPSQMRSGFLADYLVLAGSTDDTTRLQAVERTNNIFKSLSQRLGLGQEGIRNVAELREVAEGRRRGLDSQKVRIAQEMWASVVDGMAMAMCSPGLDRTLRRAVENGDGGMTRQILVSRGMRALVGAEEALMTSAIKDPDVLNLIRKYDMLIENQACRREEAEEKMYQKALEVYDSKQDIVAGADIVQLLTYLNERIESRGGVGAVNKGTNYQEQYFQQLIQDQSDQARLRAEMGEVSLNELIKAFLSIKAPRERQAQLWEYIPPDWLDGMSRDEWREVLTFAEGFFGAVYNKRNSPASENYNNSTKEVMGQILGMKNLEERDFAFFYEHPDINLKSVMHIIMRDLMVPRQVQVETYNQRGIKCKEGREFFVFRENPDGGYVDQVKLLTQNELEYKMGMVRRLVREGVVVNMGIGMIAVSMAMNVMELGGVFSLADTKRRLSWESDAVRMAQRPITKYSAKVGGEMWGGPWSEYLSYLVGFDKQAILAEAERMGIIPHLLAGSFLDENTYECEGTHGCKVRLSRAIYDDKKVIFPEVASSAAVLGLADDRTRVIETDGITAVQRGDNDMYFSWRKDHVIPACQVWGYISNDAPLEFRNFSESDNVITKWRKNLLNSIRQLRKNRDSMVTTPVIAAAIGGSTGLWPFRGPYARFVPLEEPNKWAVYNKTMGEIVNYLGLSAVEAEEILEFYGVGKRYEHDFGDKVKKYKALTNPNLSSGYRYRYQLDLRKPR